MNEHRIQLYNLTEWLGAHIIYLNKWSYYLHRHAENVAFHMMYLQMCIAPFLRMVNILYDFNMNEQ